MLTLQLNLLLFKYISGTNSPYRYINYVQYFNGLRPGLGHINAKLIVFIQLLNHSTQNTE